MARTGHLYHLFDHLCYTAILYHERVFYVKRAGRISKVSEADSLKMAKVEAQAGRNVI